MTRHTTRFRAAAGSVAAALLALAAWPLAAQDRPPGPVRFTEAREHPVQRTISLPGSVESCTESLVAAEISGLVTRMNVHEGDRVRKGQALVELHTTSLDLRRRASSAELKEAEARLQLARRTLERVRELFESKVVSQQELDDAIDESTALQARVERLAAELAQIEHDIERSTPRAPFAGVVVAEHTEVGEWLDVGGPIMEIASLDELEVRVDVPERYFSALRPGAEASITFESIPGLNLTGQIDTVIPRADPRARTFPMKVRVRDAGGRIGVGMLAEVALAAGDTYRATVVPKDAVVGEGDDQFVFLINGNSTVNRVEVQTGEGVGAWVVIRGEVRAGQKVVTRGNERLFPGQPVTGEPLEYDLP